MHKTESVLENENIILWDFEIQTDHLIPARRPDLVLIDKKRKNRHLVNFAVPADHRVKMKESEKINKNLDLARELRKLWNMKVKVVPIVIDALGMVPKALEKNLGELEIKGRIETI